MPESFPLNEHQIELRDRFLAPPVVDAPAPWVKQRPLRAGGLLGVGFAPHPETGEDLLLVASHNGLGLFSAHGERLARDEDSDRSWPDSELTCMGIGVLAGVRVRMTGLLGGGLRNTVDEGQWRLDVVSPGWPSRRVVLSATGWGPWQGEHGESWWTIFDETVTDLRAAGFSSSGSTIVAATSSDVTLWTR
ncbi:hypothetical protein AB0G04_06865 [Actinoplanes sp. NPDC023801]|uniref:hypothetical protein n=1 Tax=Actinoplanes sp. NPDC023801 TaxID=3154595 RepID=UPI00340E2DC9